MKVSCPYCRERVEEILFDPKLKNIDAGLCNKLMHYNMLYAK